MSQLTIRPATLADYPAIARLTVAGAVLLVLPGSAYAELAGPGCTRSGESCPA
jgi:hypothetical protein